MGINTEMIIIDLLQTIVKLQH